MIDFGRPVLVLQHDAAAGPGLVASWVEERSGFTELVSVPTAPHLPEPADHGLVVVLGSEHCALDEHPWIQPELDLLQRSHRDDVPVLGICFGAQLLARALGAEVMPANARAIGWQTIESVDTRVGEGPWFQWHFDTFAVPDGGTVLARSEYGIEAFAIGSSVAVQFHPEVTHEIAADWGGVYASELAEHGVDPRVLLEGAPRPAALRSRAFELFDRLT